MQNRAAFKNQKAAVVVGAADSFNLAAIFSLFLSEETKTLLENTLRFALFPLAALGSGIQMVLAWRQAKIEEWKKKTTIGRAVIETLSFLAITTAVIGGLAGIAGFALAAPIIFVAVTGIKALFHFGAACLNVGKYLVSRDADKKSEYKALAVTHAVSGFSMALTAVAVGLVMIAAKPIYALLGLAAGLIGCAYCVYKGVTARPPVGSDKLHERLLPEGSESDSTLSTSAKLHKTVGPKPGKSKGAPPLHPEHVAKAAAANGHKLERANTLDLFDPTTIEESANNILSSPANGRKLEHSDTSDTLDTISPASASFEEPKGVLLPAGNDHSINSATRLLSPSSRRPVGDL